MTKPAHSEPKPVAIEQSMPATIYYHDCPECGDTTEDYIESAVETDLECPFCDTKYIVKGL